MTSLLLIIIIVVAIGGVAVIGPLITRRLSIKVNLYIILGFLAALTVLSVICVLIPSSALKTPVDPEKVAHYFDGGEAIIGEGIHAGNFDAPEGFIKTESSFDIQAGNVTIFREAQLTFVYVGIKGVDAPDNGNNKIDIFNYSSGNVSYNGLNYNVDIDPPKCVFENGAYPKLSFMSNEKKSVDFYQFDDRYAMPQFFGTVMSSGGMGVTTCQINIVLLPPGVTYSGDGAVPLSCLGTPNL